MAYPTPAPTPVPYPNSLNGPFMPGQSTYGTQTTPTWNAVSAGRAASGITGVNTVLDQQAVAPAPTPAPAPSGQVLGDDTTSGPSEQDILNQQLDSIFNPVMSALNEQSGGVESSYQNAQSQIGSEYGLSSESLAQQNTQGQRELATQETSTGARKEDALTSATRLYNELQRGGQQRFGGASSAGEAYQTLTAVEQQRRQGTIQTAYETAMQQIGSYKTNLNEKYALAVKELEVQKNEALRTAKESFDESMRQIQAMRYQAQSDKATQSLNLLQDLRNKVFAINANTLSYAQQLAANNQMSQTTVDNYINRMNQTLGSTQLLNTNFGNQAQTTASQTRYGMGTPQAAAAPLQTGQITTKRPEEE